MNEDARYEAMANGTREEQEQVIRWWLENLKPVPRPAPPKVKLHWDYTDGVVTVLWVKSKVPTVVSFPAW